MRRGLVATVLALAAGAAWLAGCAPTGVASLAFWANPADRHGSSSFNKVGFTDYTLCPIQSGHWYYFLLVWDTSKPGGVTDQPFLPMDIFVEDQGTDGNGAGRVWSGLANCTKADQGYNDITGKFFTGDTIIKADGNFVIGADAIPGAATELNGQIDWLKWYGSASPPPSAPAHDPVSAWDYEMDLFLRAP